MKVCVSGKYTNKFCLVAYFSDTYSDRIKIIMIRALGRTTEQQLSLSGFSEKVTQSGDKESRLSEALVCSAAMCGCDESSLQTS